MGNLAAILSITSAAVGLFFTTLTYISKFIKSEKAKRTAEQVIEIGNAVLPLIKQAEQFINYTGKEKKNFVLQKAAEFAKDNDIPFDEKFISEKIEELVLLTKQVNKRDKDKKVH